MHLSEPTNHNDKAHYKSHDKTNEETHDETLGSKKGSKVMFLLSLPIFSLEREKSLELSTSTLARLRSTN
jgi:hypothetical protein